MAKVLLKTNKGDITLTLDAAKAPKSVANFLQYVKSGHYDGTIFHRVIDNFMVQGGGMTAGMKQKPTGAEIENEANNGLKNDRYTVAMARTSDPHSASLSSSSTPHYILNRRQLCLSCYTFHDDIIYQSRLANKNRYGDQNFSGNRFGLFQACSIND